jgi:hypothetical protein
MVSQFWQAAASPAEHQLFCLFRANNTCSDCIAGFTFFAADNNSCTPTPNITNCTQQGGLVNGSCISCNVLNCASCSAANVCGQCQNIYNFINGACLPLSCAVAHCKTCTSNDVCGICRTNFSLFNLTCVSCPIANCLTCQVANTCL